MVLQKEAFEDYNDITNIKPEIRLLYLRLVNNNIRSEVSKYNLPYNKFTIKSGVKIVDDRIVIKNKNNNDIDKTYNYLRSRAFDYFPYPIEESNKYEIYPYIEDVYEPREQKGYGYGAFT